MGRRHNRVDGNERSSPARSPASVFASRLDASSVGAEIGSKEPTPASCTCRRAPVRPDGRRRGAARSLSRRTRSSLRRARSQRPSRAVVRHAATAVLRACTRERRTIVIKDQPTRPSKAQVRSDPRGSALLLGGGRRYVRTGPTSFGAAARLGNAFGCPPLHPSGGCSQRPGGRRCPLVDPPAAWTCTRPARQQPWL